MLGRGDSQKFWALRHVDLHVQRGESLAVIGPNGAGKSTLLQVLAGIIQPSEGVVDVIGHVSGLLTLGAGFDKELTGRDNILLGGAFLGLDDAVTRQLLPSIIEYAELGDFIDAPLKTYSSGMRARLGFAIATSVDPDILLLDEVLATGDANFRAKSKARVIEIVSAAKAVVLVTHDMNWVTEYCNRAILIERGELVMEGEPAAVVELHQRPHRGGTRPNRGGRGGGRGRPEDRPRPLGRSAAADDRHHRADGAEDTGHSQGALPVEQRSDVALDAAGDHHAGEALPVERHVVGHHVRDRGLLHVHVPGEHVAHVRLADLRLAGEGECETTHRRGHPVGACDRDAAHGDRDLLGLDPADPALVDVDTLGAHDVGAAVLDGEDVDIDVGRV